MTTVQVQLPDDLARDAQAAGLLTPESMEHLLREQSPTPAPMACSATQPAESPAQYDLEWWRQGRSRGDALPTSCNAFLAAIQIEDRAL